MPDNTNRKQLIQVKFFVDEKELGMIKMKISQTEERIGELDHLFIKFYEDEQTQLKVEIANLKKEIDVQEGGSI